MTKKGLSENDPSSFSNPNVCVVTNIGIHWLVDFDRKILRGYVDLSVRKVDPNATTLVLDSRKLHIFSVKDKASEEKLHYNFGEYIEFFGSKLEITLPKATTETLVIRIEYETDPAAGAFQWLEPFQTSGKKYPFVYNISQPIEIRSVLPCQDTPSVKFTYTATVNAPSHMTVLMSAIKSGACLIGEAPISGNIGTKQHKFIQKVPVPSYLLCIVVGDLETKKIGPRSYVWAEKEIINQAAFEFEDVEEKLKAAEKLLGPYVWDKYDLLVLPPFYPSGGTEYPCLTYTTPTILAGDKSLVDVVVHEICHSWTGNLVTCKSFEHFWLNEGFTEFLNHKLIGLSHGESVRHFMTFLDWECLKEEIDLEENKNATKLVWDLRGCIIPLNIVPYFKGEIFLFYLEDLLGGAEVFDPFIRSYIEKFKFRSINTEEWKNYLYDYFSDKKQILDSVDWNTWLYGVGMPPVKLNLDMTPVQKCIDLSLRWINAKNDFNEFTKADLKDMYYGQVRKFLRLLSGKENFGEEKMKKLTEIYGFDHIKNSEILSEWLMLGIKLHWKPIVPHAIKFITEQGRMKFVKPIYRELYNWSETKELAVTTYKEHRRKYMNKTRRPVDSVLKIKDDSSYL